MVFGVIAVVWVWDSLVAGYSERPFSMAERLLTQGRVMMFYLKEIFIPGLSGLALYHDDYGVYRLVETHVYAVFRNLLWQW